VILLVIAVVAFLLAMGLLSGGMRL